MNRVLYGQNGKKVVLGKEIGQGGEGIVYDIDNSDGRHVAKVYWRTPTLDKQKKLLAMTSLTSANLTKIATWPISTLHQSAGTGVAGFVMPKMTTSLDIFKLYNPAERKDNFPDKDWAFLIHAARNVAAAFAVLHSAGHAIGDVNQRNVCISHQAVATLVDCDSFQINTSSQVFYCGVGVPEYTPPELQGKNLTDVVRTKNHDAFGLACIIFQLLFMGRHPFSGRYSGAGDMPFPRAIREFRFAYSASAAAKKMAPPPNMYDLSALSHPLATMFEAAFAQNGVFKSNRPSAEQWVKALDDLKKQLVTCQLIPSHKYVPNGNRCLWCELDLAGHSFFPSGSASVQNIEIDIDALWQKIRDIRPPNSAGLPEFHHQPNSSYLSELHLHDRRRPHAIALLKNMRTRTDADRIAAQRRYDEAKRRWQLLSADHAFDKKKRELTNVRDHLAAHQTNFKTQVQALGRQVEADQRQRYLESFTIRRANIPGIGQARTLSLISFGVETAADVEYSRILSIPGFGPTFAMDLVHWRRSLEQRFVLNPKGIIDPRHLLDLQRKFAIAVNPLRQELESGPEALTVIRDQITADRQQIRIELGRVSLAAAEAAADLATINREIERLEKAQRNWVQRTVAFAAIVILGVGTSLYATGFGGLLSLTSEGMNASGSGNKSAPDGNPVAVASLGESATLDVGSQAATRTVPQDVVTATSVSDMRSLRNYAFLDGTIMYPDGWTITYTDGTLRLTSDMRAVELWWTDNRTLLRELAGIDNKAESVLQAVAESNEQSKFSVIESLFGPVNTYDQFTSTDFAGYPILGDYRFEAAVMPGVDGAVSVYMGGTHFLCGRGRICHIMATKLNEPLTDMEWHVAETFAAHLTFAE